MIDSFLKELFVKLTAILRESEFKVQSLECPNIFNESMDSITSVKNSEPNQFESQLFDAISTVQMIKQRLNSSYSFEYYLKVNVFGRDGNEFRLLPDESPVLTELATIDNAGFSLTSNVSLKSPRRFFRIGVAEVGIQKYI